MKSKKIAIFAGITLLFLLQSFAVGAAPSPSIATNVITAGSSANAHIESINPTITKDYVLFADTPDEYTTLTSFFNAKYEFPLLRAIVVDLSDTQAKAFGKLFGAAIPLASFDNLPMPIVTPSDDSSLSLDAVEDADIMHVSEMWSAGYTGQGIFIGQIDNGVDTTHPALNSKIVEQQIFHGSTGVWTPFHGTNVAGTMVGDARDDGAASGDDLNAIGNAYGAKLYSAGLYASDDGKSVIGGIYMLQAYEWMLSLNNTVSVVNLSLGGGYSSTFQEINERMEEAGIMVVASAGNEGPTGGTVGCPSCYTNAISVAAEDHSRSTAYFSSRGPSALPGLKPDVIAPGVDILTSSWDNPNHGYERVDGTSFSSPLTAAGLAVLMSALNTEGYTWNPGTIKAALIRGAYQDTPSFTGDYEVGMGEVDIKDSWDYLLAQNPTAGFAKAVAMTPLSNNIFDTKLFTNIVTKQRGFTLISSNPGDVVVSVSGDISQFLSVDTGSISATKYSQELPLLIDTTGITAGTYSGTITATLNGETVTASLSYNVVGPAAGTVAFDMRHTDWDTDGADTLIGSNTGAMVANMKANDYWVDPIDEVLTPTLLQNYDLVWIPDPVDMTFSYLGETYPFEGSYFTDAEVSALVDYVNNGGNLLIDFNGLFTDDTTGQNIGTNATAINKLISNFGITSSSNVGWGDINTKFADIANITTITGGATKVVEAGNYLIADTAAAAADHAILYPITGTAAKTGIAAYDKLNGGRVIVTSTNFWLDNQGSTTGYTAGDPEVAQGAFDWLTTDNRITLIKSNISTSQITATVHVRPDVAPTVSRLAAVGLSALTIPTTSIGGGNYTITYDLTEDGRHHVQAVAGTTDYIAFDTLLDLHGPTITPELANNSIVDKDAGYWPFAFQVVDTTYVLGYDDIALSIDGVPKSLQQLTRRIVEETKLIVSIFTTTIDTSVANHTIGINATDNNNHTTVYVYGFTLGVPIVTTTSTTNSTTTTTTTTTTSTTTPTKAKGLPLNISAVFVAIAVVGVFVNRQKFVRYK